MIEGGREKKGRPHLYLSTRGEKILAEKEK